MNLAQNLGVFAVLFPDRPALIEEPDRKNPQKDLRVQFHGGK